jgi:hypothetical protein
LEWKMFLYHYGYSIHWMPVPKKKCRKGITGG